MFSKYFEEWNIKPDYSKEFVSLWSGWLGEENYYKLDEVTEKEWMRFNDWIRILAENFTIETVDCKNQSTSKVKDIESVLAGYEESMNKDSTLFTKLVIPELDCVISEEWDYTYIIWHKDNGAVEALTSSITKAGLKHFND